MNRAIIDAQYGDGGKGKIVDYFAKDSDYAVRFNGSGNAGHCIEKEDGTRHAVHILPAAVYNPGVTCCTSAGMVINPETLYEEIQQINQTGIKNTVLIDSRAHVVTGLHIKHDEISELKLGEEKIGTTLTGNGPAYADKMLRRGIRLMDLCKSPEEIAQKLYKSNSNITENSLMDFDYEAKRLHSIGIKLLPYLADVAMELDHAIERGKSILFAGAHGSFLDIDHGHYPYVTSSSCTIGGIGSTGVSPTHIDEVVGVIKAYTTRSGAGPMPFMQRYIADEIREKANEYGTTTGRPRRIGWMDLHMIKRAAIINDFTYGALTMLDIFSGMPEIKLKGISETHRFNGWQEDISRIKSYDELPTEAKTFIDFIENYTQIRMMLISVGPKKSQTIDRRA